MKILDMPEIYSTDVRNQLADNSFGLFYATLSTGAGSVKVYHAYLLCEQILIENYISYESDSSSRHIA